MRLDPDTLDFEKGRGLIPAIVQDIATLQVLMLAFMDRAALEETLRTGEAVFFSRSRGGCWKKGETSGHVLLVEEALTDCDRDTILLRVHPLGPACHLGTISCFGDNDAPGLGVLARLEQTIEARVGADPAKSYTARLLSEGYKRCAQKIGEEGVETALAIAAGSRDETVSEAADLLFHLLVGLRASDIALEEVLNELRRRAARPVGPHAAKH